MRAYNSDKPSNTRTIVPSHGSDSVVNQIAHVCAKIELQIFPTFIVAVEFSKCIKEINKPLT